MELHQTTVTQEVSRTMTPISDMTPKVPLIGEEVTSRIVRD